jgi:hypothetical protein
LASTPERLKNNVKSEFHAPIAVPLSLSLTTQCFSVMGVMPVGISFVLKVRTLCLLCLMVPGFAQPVLPVIMFHLLPFVHSAIELKRSKIVPFVARKRRNGMPFFPVVFTIACVMNTKMSFRSRTA